VSFFTARIKEADIHNGAGNRR